MIPSHQVVNYQDCPHHPSVLTIRALYISSCHCQIIIVETLRPSNKYSFSFPFWSNVTCCVYVFSPYFHGKYPILGKFNRNRKKAPRYIWFRSLLHPRVQRFFSRLPRFSPSIKTLTNHVRGARLEKTMTIVDNSTPYFTFSISPITGLISFPFRLSLRFALLTLFRFSSFLEMIPRSPVRLTKTRRKSK